ncbi:MAG TPA: hypothetical protein VMW52_09250 [Phycisphaerae bacterium]|nr:hypothetical protein [Phycisphaerae bacterium]
MIVIRVELWPGGDETRAEDLGTARIVNTVAASVASGGELGDYRVELLKGARYSRRAGEIWKACTVTGFPRRGLGPWDLLFRGLRDLVGYRNRP